MRAFLTAALLLVPAILFAPPTAADSCSTYEHFEWVVPNTNYYVAVDVSRCQSTSPVLTQNRETILVTRGDPSQPGHTVLAQITFLSARSGYAGGAGTVTDSLTITSDQTSVSTTYSSTRTSSGFTTCSANARVTTGPGSTTSAGTGTMNQCAPQDQMLI